MENIDREIAHLEGLKYKAPGAWAIYHRSYLLCSRTYRTDLINQINVENHQGQHMMCFNGAKAAAVSELNLLRRSLPFRRSQLVCKGPVDELFRPQKGKKSEI